MKTLQFTFKIEIPTITLPQSNIYMFKMEKCIFINKRRALYYILAFLWRGIQVSVPFCNPLLKIEYNFFINTAYILLPDNLQTLMAS